MFSWLTRTKNNVVITVQTGEGFVEGAVSTLGDDARVLFSKRIPLTTKRVARVDALTQLIRSFFALPEIKTGSIRFEDAQIQCFFVTPLSQCITYETSAELKQSTRVTLSLLRRVFNEGNITQQQEGEIPEGAAVYSMHVSRVRLNGYITDAPVGKYARTIAITVDQCYTSHEQWHAVVPELERVFGRECACSHGDEPIDVLMQARSGVLYTPGVPEAQLDAIIEE